MLVRQLTLSLLVITKILFSNNFLKLVITCSMHLLVSWFGMYTHSAFCRPVPSDTEMSPRIGIMR